jgi:hypothetical protein
MSLTINGSTGSIIGTLPAGMVMYFANTTVPQGWFQCNGAAILRANYPELFAAIGTTYGTGNGSTTFNLPDFRGQFLRAWPSATPTVATFTGTINNVATPTPAAGNILTVTTQPTGTLRIGQVITGGTTAAGTTIIAQTGGTTGGIGTYTVSGAVQSVTSTTLTASVPDAGRAIGSPQNDASRRITGGVTNVGKVNTASGTTFTTTGALSITGSSAGNSGVGSGGNSGLDINLDSGVQVPVANEIRPVNSALMVCIKY